MAHSFDDLLAQEQSTWTTDQKAIAGAARKQYTEDFDAVAAFGQQLRAARRNAHLTQTQAATKAGLHQSDVSDIERGIANPTLRSIARLAAAVGATLSIESAYAGAEVSISG